jgi:hypothetical protein
MNTSLQKLDHLVALGVAFTKVGIFVGGTCLIIYSLHIGRFPQGLTLGDGILLIMVAACVGVLFTFFIAGLIGLAITVMAPIRWMLRTLKNHVPWMRRKLSAPHMPLPTLSAFSVAFALVGVLWIYVLGLRDMAAWWQLPLLSLGLFFPYAIYRYAGIQIAARAKLSMWSPTPESGTGFRRHSAQELRQFITTAPALILLFVLYVLSQSGAGWTLLEGAMSVAHIRSQPTLVYLRAPYRDMIPPVLGATGATPVPEYGAFSGVVILFAGIGTSSAIQFADKVGCNRWTSLTIT